MPILSKFIIKNRTYIDNAVIRKIFYQPLSSNNLFLQLKNYSNDNNHKSVLGPPKIKSPFDNPHRIHKVNHALTFTTNNKTILDTKENKQEEIFENKNDKIEDDVKLTSSPEPVIVAKEFTTNSKTDIKQPLFWIKLNEKLGYRIDDSMPDSEKKKIKIARNTFLGSIFVFGSLFVGFVWFCFHYGKSPKDVEGNVIPDEFTGESFGWFYRILNSFKLWKDYVVEPSRDKLLPDALPYPYHQPKYTLVIEMKNVLVAPEWTYKTGYRFKKRPALDYFLDVVGYPNFEVVIYTSESSMTAPSVIDNMDPKQRIMYKLYRDCTKYMNGHHLKDLNKLNRDLSKVIYIDFDPKSFQLNPDNVLRVPKWEGDMEDASLVDLAELLKTIHLSDVDDVRPVLQYYSQFDDPMKEFRRRAQYLAEQEHRKVEDGNQSALKRYAGKLFGFRRHTNA